MTVLNTQVEESWAGDASTVTFSIPFPFFDRDDLLPVKRSAAGDLTNMTIVSHTGGNGLPGSITLSAVVGVGNTLTVYRVTDAVQQTDYTANDSFPAESHERALDRLTLLAQEAQTAQLLAPGGSRYLQFPRGDAWVSPVLPAKSLRSGKLLGFGVNGEPILHTPEVTTNFYDGAPLTEWLEASDAFAVNLLKYIPYQEWSNILNRTGPLYDASDAFQRAHDENPSGIKIEIPGRIGIGDTVRITKPIRVSGTCSDASGQTSEIWRLSALEAPAFIVGNEADNGIFISGPHWDNITFREQRQYVIGGAMKEQHFMHMNGIVKGGFRECIFNGDMLGAWIYMRRCQDFPFFYCFFRGGGSDIGNHAQILVGPPQNSQETMNHINNDVVFEYCTFEWGPNTGNAYIDPVTGLAATADGNGYRPSRGSVAIKSDGPNIDNRHNSFRFSECKFEMTTGRGWDGEGLRKAAIYLRNAPMWQFIGCEFNQTSWQFDVENCDALYIQGSAFYGGGQGAADNRRKFGKWVDCDQLQVNVRFSFNGPSAGPIINCPGHDVVVDSALGTTGIPRFAMERKAEFGDRYKSAMFKTLSQSTLVKDVRGTGGEAIRSREIATETEYGTGLLELRPSNRKERPNGMTIRVRACLENAPTGDHKLSFSWYWFPADIAYFDEPDGVITTWAAPMFFAPDSDFPGSEEVLTPIRAYKRHKITGAETEVVISSKSGENDWNGGTVTLAEAVPATHEVVIRRQAYGKGIIVQPSSGGLTQTPTWYSAYIPPNVLKLENVVIQVRAEGDWGAGVRYRILDWDYGEEAECPTIPYYPMNAGSSGPGLPPNGNGWTAADSIIRCSKPGTQGGLYYRCVNASANNGAGQWQLLTPSFSTYTYGGSGGSYPLPSIASLGNIEGGRYTIHNAGTGALTVSPDAADAFASCTFTSFVLDPGESAVVEVVSVPSTGLRWAIMTGVACVAALVGASNPSQVVATGAAQKVTLFNTNTISRNCLSDQANDRVTVQRSGNYRVSLNFSGPCDVATILFTWTIKVNGTTVGHLKALEYYGAANQEEIVCLSGDVGPVLAGQHIEVFVQHSGGGNATLTAWNCSLYVERVA